MGKRARECEREREREREKGRERERERVSDCLLSMCVRYLGRLGIAVEVNGITISQTIVQVSVATIRLHKGTWQDRMESSRSVRQRTFPNPKPSTLTRNPRNPGTSD